MAQWLAPQADITLYTSRNAPLPVRVGANHCVGHVGSVRWFSVSWTSGGRSTVQPSAS